MSDRNKADENPDDEYLLDALRDLDPTPIEELIDKSNMDDPSVESDADLIKYAREIVHGDMLIDW